MLARASSDAGTRLRRSKSTSTVHRHPPPISDLLDPHAAQQQALAAATAAFARAHSQDVTDRKSKRNSDMARSKSNASRKSLTSQGSHFPPRESSFRCLQPQNTGQSTSTRLRSRATTVNIEQFSPFHPPTSTDESKSSSRPQSSHASTTFGETRPRSQSKAQQQGAPSSITSQQIRKARSMYYASSVQTGSPIARPPAQYLTPPLRVGDLPQIETVSGMPPMRTLEPSPLTGHRIPVIVAADETMDTARDKYLHSFQQKTVKHKPSMLLAPFKKRQDKSKDKSKRVTTGIMSRSNSTQRTTDEPTADITLVEFNPPTEPKEKRSFSGSLKSRFKKVFRRTSNRSPNLPVQQIEASRDYFSSTNLKVSPIDDMPDIPSPHEDMLQRVRSRTPSYEILRPAFTRSGSRTSSNGSSRSNRSLHSETNATYISTSRVTSWGTTATDDAVTQRAIKRLTVIHEAKDSIGSETDRMSSLVPKRKSLPSPALASFRDPMPMDSLAEECLTPVDPKRIFSALMREIGSSNSTQPATGRKDRTPGAESDVFESSATKELHHIARELHSSASRDCRPSTSSDHRPPTRRPASAASHSVQSKTSTMRSLGRAIRSTIRTVTPAEQQPPPFPDPAGNAYDAEYGRDDHTRRTSLGIETECEGTNTNSGHARTRSGVLTDLKPAESDCPIRTYTPSASQIEQRVERAKARWKTPLDEAEKLQFPRETNRTYNVASFRQQPDSHFPEKEAMPHIAKTGIFKHQSDQGTPKPPAITSPMSPSVYSRDTDGMSILPNESVVSLDAPDVLKCSHNGGSAVILTSQSVRSYVIGTPSPRRPDSTRTSRDWKAWLSHEISSMESSSQEDLTIHQRFTTPSGKHRHDIMRTSHTEQDGDTTVILRESCDIPTPRLGLEAELVDSTTVAIPQHDVLYDSDPESSNFGTKPAFLEECDSHSDTYKEASPTHTPTEDVPVQMGAASSRPGQTPLLATARVQPTFNRRSRTSQPAVDSPHPSIMNDRFPYIETGRSSSSNSARSSRLSKSPPESVASDKSLKATPSPRIYSDLTAPGANRTSQRASNVALKRSDAMHKRKENVTPPALRANMAPSASSLALASRTRSLQPLSPTVTNKNAPSNSQYMSNIPEIKHAKHDSSPAASPARPRIHATLRPASTNDLSRRPRSAFDLRSPRKYRKTGIPTVATRPTSELRRSALHSDNSTASVDVGDTSIAERVRDTTSVSRPASRSGSITPGQRMADHWLKQRKSTSAFENNKMRGGMKLVREDTPAFL
ncbi:hypothetical protein T440DRAFT_522044 [Plenodomus tracheiphilus IPT5]|uniref:Uncharacterized protein n=1 Tax=Plenodomus tracheiphilus IPT5 TaxID=1408161 RepID=A0A6A7AVE2_9PLEO|nr:hypothetical protein T440DRAFT_522044 [Plenodomus tracheiphilus IPT5]